MITKPGLSFRRTQLTQQRRLQPGYLSDSDIQLVEVGTIHLQSSDPVTASRHHKDFFKCSVDDGVTIDESHKLCVNISLYTVYKQLR